MRKLENALGAEHRRRNAEEYAILGTSGCLIVEVGPLPVVATEKLHPRPFDQDLARPASRLCQASSTNIELSSGDVEGMSKGTRFRQGYTLQARVHASGKGTRFKHGAAQR